MRPRISPITQANSKKVYYLVQVEQAEVEQDDGNPSRKLIMREMLYTVFTPDFILAFGWLNLESGKIVSDLKVMEVF